MSKKNFTPFEDFGGDSKSQALENKIIELSMNNFKHTKWPFKFQTPEEFEFLLKKYNLMIVKNEFNDFMFIPFIPKQKSILNKIRRVNETFTAVSIYSSFNLNKAIEGLPVIPLFSDNVLRIPPQKQTKQHFLNISSIENAKVYNRYLRQKQSIVQAEDAEESIKLFNSILNIRTFNPFIIIPKKLGLKKDKSDFLNKVKFLTATSDKDFSNILHFERKEEEEEIKLIYGIFTNGNNNKSGIVQETDDQVFNNYNEVTQILKARYRARLSFLSLIKKVYSSDPVIQNWSIEFNTNIKNKLNNIEQAEKNFEEGGQ